MVHVDDRIPGGYDFDPADGPTLHPADGAALLRLAVATVEARLRGRLDPDEVPASPALCVPGASFVTLEAHGRLRGCIGSVEAVRPLYLDVIHNAVQAMRDPRLPAVTDRDWPDLDVKVSVLHPGGAVPADTRVSLASALRPGVDGLILSDGVRRATFLPAVWRTLPEPERFITALLTKGGWEDGEWPRGLAASRYTAEEFADRGPRPPLN